LPAALISVFDKIGIVSFARGLHGLGFEIISSGGTAKTLRENKVPVTEVSDYTGFPEMMDGRVKTLHPKIHGGILYKRGNKEHEEAKEKHGIKSIDLVAVNLYPFEKTIAKQGVVSFEEIIENIDIGGPSLVRAAAKNFESVGIVVNPSDYEHVLHELQEHKKLSHATRAELMRKAFEHTAAYDAGIAAFFAKQQKGSASFPEKLVLSWEKAIELRYGENPHQKSAFYRTPGEQAFSDLLVQGGKELSFNNILDVNSAWSLTNTLASGMHSCVIVKHNNPCGVSLAGSQLQAWQKAFAGDTISPFGGIIAFNRPLEAETAREMTKLFLEVVISPGFADGALEILGEKKNLRVINAEALVGKQKAFDGRTVLNGFLWQEADNSLLKEFKAVTKREPSEGEKRDLNFALAVCKHVKSNAIVLAKNLQAIGICGGQTNRVDCVFMAGERAKKFGFNTSGCVMASDAFFPFKDSVEKAADLGVNAIIQPGGSIKDKESIDECDKHGISMVFTAMRHFRH